MSSKTNVTHQRASGAPAVANAGSSPTPSPLEALRAAAALEIMSRSHMASASPSTSPQRTKRKRAIQACSDKNSSTQAPSPTSTPTSPPAKRMPAASAFDHVAACAAAQNRAQSHFDSQTPHAEQKSQLALPPQRQSDLLAGESTSRVTNPDASLAVRQSMHLQMIHRRHLSVLAQHQHRVLLQQQQQQLQQQLARHAWLQQQQKLQRRQTPTTTGTQKPSTVLCATCSCGKARVPLHKLTLPRFQTLVRQHAACHAKSPQQLLCQTLAWCGYDGSPWSSKTFLRRTDQPLRQTATNAKLIIDAMDAINRVDAGALKKLLRSGLDPNAADKFGYTLMHRVCKRGFFKGYMLLKSHGADRLCIDDCGRTLVHETCWASKRFDPRILVDLMELAPDLLSAADRLQAVPLDYLQDDAALAAVCSIIVGNADRFWFTRGKGEPVLAADSDIFLAPASVTPRSLSLLASGAPAHVLAPAGAMVIDFSPAGATAASYAAAVAAAKARRARRNSVTKRLAKASELNSATRDNKKPALKSASTAPQFSQPSPSRFEMSDVKHSQSLVAKAR